MEVNSENNQIWKILIPLLLLYSCENPPTYFKSELKRESDRKKKLISLYENGKSVYDKHCNHCHRLNVKDGANWSNRITNKEDEELTHNFILSSSNLRKDSNEYVIDIKTEYNNTDYEHEFKNVLNDKEMSNLILFLKVESEK